MVEHAVGLDVGLEDLRCEVCVALHLSRDGVELEIFLACCAFAMFERLEEESDE